MVTLVAETFVVYNMCSAIAHNYAYEILYVHVHVGVEGGTHLIQMCWAIYYNTPKFVIRGPL